MLAPVLAPVLAVHNVMPQIVAQVAALAPAFQVPESVVVLIAIYMGSGEHHGAACLWVWLTVLCTAIWIEGRSFTAVDAKGFDYA